MAQHDWNEDRVRRQNSNLLVDCEARHFESKGPHCYECHLSFFVLLRHILRVLFFSQGLYGEVKLVFVVDEVREHWHCNRIVHKTVAKLTRWALDVEYNLRLAVKALVALVDAYLVVLVGTGFARFALSVVNEKRDSFHLVFISLYC